MMKLSDDLMLLAFIVALAEIIVDGVHLKVIIGESVLMIGSLKNRLNIVWKKY